MQSLGNIFISNCNKAMRKQGNLVKIKEKERNRHPGHVNNVGMPVAKIIE